MLDQKSFFLGRSILVFLLTVILSLLLSSLFFLAIGLNVFEAYSIIIRGSLGSPGRFLEVLVKFVPITMTSLAAVVALNAGFYNIGAEGQFITGAIVVTGISILFNQVGLEPPLFLGLLIVLALGFFSGGGAALLAYVLKYKFNANEIVFTVIYNILASLMIEYLVVGPWRDLSIPEPLSLPLQPSMRMPVLIQGTRLHAGVLVLSLIIVGILLFQKTIFWYMLRLLGQSQLVSELSGLNTGKILMYACLISGGLAGLAGGIEVSGVHHRLVRGFSQGYGFIGLIVAYTSRLNATTSIVTSFFYSLILTGADPLQRIYKIPYSAIYVLLALILASSFIADFLIRTIGKRVGRWSL